MSTPISCAGETESRMGDRFNPGIASLQPYPFERLRALIGDVSPPKAMTPTPLSIGEPQHPTPALITQALADHSAESLGKYPATLGLPALRECIADWLIKRFNLSPKAIDPNQNILPASGTREALFAVTQALLDPQEKPAVFMPNPFYQIYEGAALLAGGQPVFLNADERSDQLPDLRSVSKAQWKRCGIIYVCTPGNPSGRVIPQWFWEQLFALQDEHGFIIAADECYSELYRDETSPPLGLLSACQAAGRDRFDGCLVFHSLSKRSNAPGLRSGFIAGDAELIKAFGRYRTYQGCAQPLHVQHASIAAWQDEAHVRDNREAYRRKFQMASALIQPIQPYREPEAGFYIWLPVPSGDDEAFTRGLYQHTGVTVLPGSYLSRETARGNPGAGYVRIALVAAPAICEDALQRMADFLSRETQE